MKYLFLVAIVISVMALFNGSVLFGILGILLVIMGFEVRGSADRQVEREITEEFDVEKKWVKKVKS